MKSLIVNLINALPGGLVRAIAQNSVLSRVFRPLLNQVLPEGPTPVVIRSGPARGLRLLIHPTTEKPFWTGIHELPVQETLVSTLADGAVFWDVGAHCGFYTCLASRLVGPQGQVVAFEPSPVTRGRLERAIEMNSASNVCIEDRAVAARNGEAVLHSDKSSTEWSLVGRGGDGVKVSCRTLDALAAEHRPPDVVKIDVEGAEMEVMSGGRNLLHSHRPVLLVEFHDGPPTSNLAELADYGEPRLLCEGGPYDASQVWLFIQKAI
jgi:FkbM family methyltransferase